MTLLILLIIFKKKIEKLKFFSFLFKDVLFKFFLFPKNLSKIIHLKMN
jgi:hypothetical protein